MGEIYVYREGHGVIPRTQAMTLDMEAARHAPRKEIPAWTLNSRAKGGRWVFRNGELVDARTAAPLVSQGVSTQVIRDIEPYKATKTGEMIGSRSEHREYLRRNGFIEVGNERAAMNPSRPDVAPAHADVKRAMEQHGWRG